MTVGRFKAVTELQLEADIVPLPVKVGEMVAEAEA